MAPFPDVLGASRTIVVADDDRDIRELLANRLESAGYSVVQAEDGVGALALIRNALPQLVLLDVSMPLLSGLDVLQAMKADEELSGIPVILLTGKSDENEVVVGQAMGAVNYVVKPFSPKEVVLLIEQLV
jgi:DNA-binding response OmpR family regulator